MALRTLTFTTLYPNQRQPSRGVFVENRLRHLIAGGEVETRVVAPVPWFPSTSARFGSYAEFAAVPGRETRHGIAVEHPRYPLIPKIGMTSAPFCLAWAARPSLRRLKQAGFDFDLIDAHYFYPDGVAAIMLAEHFGRPAVITGHGTDLDLIPRYRLPRALIRRAARRAAGLITVSATLKQRLIDLGVPAERITVLGNHVDLDVFRPLDRAACRAALSLTPPVIAAVGNLIGLKRHRLIIEALPALPEVTLALVGDGPLKASLADLARRHGVAERVRFLGTLAHEDLAGVYSAADVLVHPSEREGWPCVLLEALACGTPLIATPVGATPEIVTAPAAGRLLSDPSPAAIAETVAALLREPPARDATRAHATGFGWHTISAAQLALFRDILERGPAQSSI